MRYFNVIHRPSENPSTQYLIGADPTLARAVAADSSSRMKKGDEVVLWSIDNETKEQAEMACIC